MNKISEYMEAHLQNVELAPGGACATVEFTPDFPGFGGHFEGNPVVPGVCLMEAALVLLARLIGGTPALKEVRQVKFFRPLVPGDAVKMELAWQEEERLAKFSAAHASDAGKVAKFNFEVAP